MSKQDIATLRKKINRIGAWVGVRMMKNRGIPFEQAYFVMFDRYPRF